MMTLRPLPMRPSTLPIGSTRTSSKPPFSISWRTRAATGPSWQLSAGMAIKSRKKATISASAARARSVTCSRRDWIISAGVIDVLNRLFRHRPAVATTRARGFRFLAALLFPQCAQNVFGANGQFVEADADGIEDGVGHGGGGRIDWHFRDGLGAGGAGRVLRPPPKGGPGWGI